MKGTRVFIQLQTLTDVIYVYFSYRAFYDSLLREVHGVFFKHGSNQVSTLKCAHSQRRNVNLRSLQRHTANVDERTAASFSSGSRRCKRTRTDWKSLTPTYRDTGQGFKTAKPPGPLMINYQTAGLQVTDQPAH